MFGKNISNYIGINRIYRRLAHISGAMLLLLIIFTVFPIYSIQEKVEATTKNPNPSTLTFAFVNNKSVASVNLTVSDPTGSFITSNNNEQVEFSIYTNNATGYTLNLKANESISALSDGTNSIPSIDSAKTSSNFTTNTWGLLPNKYNGIDNSTNYYPASDNGFIMDETNEANNVANYYTIGLGLKVDYTTPAGVYNNSSIIAEFVANPISYSVYYYSNTEDAVTNMPSTNPQTGTISQGTTATSIYIASAPSRNNYTFLGWCLGTNSSSNITTNDGTDTCNSTLYDAGQFFGIDATLSPDTYYLYAAWSINSYTCIKQYRLQNADGSFPDIYTADGTEQIKLGHTCSYSKSVADYKDSVSGTNGAQASTSGTMTDDGLILSLDFYRNTYTLTVSSGTNTSSPTGGGSKRWGEDVTIGVTKAGDVVCTAYSTPTWTANVGTAPAAGESSTYTMPKSNATVTATSSSSKIPQTITILRSNASSITIAGTTYTSSSISLDCGTYNISGAYPTGYEFDTWAVSGSVSVNSALSASSRVTISGAGTLTLKGREIFDGTIQKMTVALCQSVASSGNYTVTDSRDNQTYTVRYDSGICWMTKNLAIGCDGIGATYGSNISSKTLTSSDSNVTNTNANPWYTPTDLLTASSSSTHSADYSTPRMLCSSKYGAWYNYAAVTAGTIIGELNRETDIYNICPAGWTLPDLLVDSVAQSKFQVVIGGRYIEGAINFDTWGFWWGTTPSQHEEYIDKNRIGYNYSDYNSSLFKNWYHDRATGQYTRCVRKN